MLTRRLLSSLGQIVYSCLSFFVWGFLSAALSPDQSGAMSGLQEWNDTVAWQEWVLDGGWNRNVARMERVCRRARLRGCGGWDFSQIFAILIPIFFEKCDFLPKNFQNIFSFRGFQRHFPEGCPY